MQNARTSCNDLLSALNATIAKFYAEKSSQPVANHTTLSDSDPTGALKFTIAVVLLYGVGVIGLLGISARRNRTVELMDKDVNKFLKYRFQRPSFKRKPKPKKSISKLISALHIPVKFDESYQAPCENTKPLLLQRSNTWTGGMGATANSNSNLNKALSMSLSDACKASNDSTGSNIDPLVKYSQIPRRHNRPSLSHQELQLDGLGRIEEENFDEYSGDNATDLIEVRIITPRGSIHIENGAAVMNSIPSPVENSHP